jgi:hypothetical protein
MSLRSLLNRSNQEGGQIAIGFILMVFAIFMFFAFAFDAGIWYFDHRTAQNEVDAAALAGALELPSQSNAQAAVTAYLEKNGVVSPNGAANLCPGWTSASSVFSSSGGTLDRVRVCQRRTSVSVFAAMSSIAGVKVSAQALARQIEEPVRYAIMVMDPDNCQAFNVTGGAQVFVHDTTGLNQGGATLTLSNSTCQSGALSVANNSKLVATSHDVVGTAPSCSNGCLTGTVSHSIAAFDDPWASLTAPIPSGTCLNGTYNSGTPVLQPGWYCNGINIGASAHATFQPGVYVLAPGTAGAPASDLNFSTNASGSVTGSNVTFYLTCNPWPCAGVRTAGQVTMGAQGSINLDSNTSNPYVENSRKDILIWLDRTSNGGNGSPEVNINGGSSSSLDGHIYAFSSDVQVTGGSQQTPVSLNISILANSLSFSGNSYINLNWDVVHAIKIDRLALIE